MLKLTQKGVKREDAYKVVQKNAMEVWKHKKNFYNLIIKDKYIKKYLSNSEIKKLFDLNSHKKYINTVLKRVLK